MIKYKTGDYNIPIVEVEVVKESKVSIWTQWGNTDRFTRATKRSSWHNYFDTWEEAHEFLMSEAQSKVNSLSRQLELAKGKLGNIKGLTPNRKDKEGGE